MGSAEQKILNNYFGLLEKLTPKMKLSLIERLKESALKSKVRKSNINKAFGAWSSAETAEELITTIRSNRIVNRELEEF